VNGLSADNVTSFTLGSVGVSPMSMAAAYASVAARGWYCPPNSITKIATSSGKLLPLKPHGCHRDMSRAVADAANYILQGVLNNPLGTAAGHGIGRPAAGKTGTSNSGYYAAFAGYTPTLAGYVDVFNPIGPTTAAGQMLGLGSCYRDVGDDFPSCPGQMYGDNAPRATWEYTFLRAQLGAPIPFVSPPGYFFAQGAGDSPVIVQPKPKNPKRGGPPGGPPPPGGPHHH
jgi:membrane peptidoglycan carboxypeptidase